MKFTTQENQFPLAPEGRHAATIIEASEWLNPDGPNKLIVEFLFTHPDTLESIKKRVFILPTLAEGDGFRVFGDLLNLIQKDHDSEGEFDPSELESKDCYITIKHTKGKGRHEGKTFDNLVMVEPLEKKV